MISSSSSAAPCSLADSLNKQETDIRENGLRNKGGKKDKRSRDSLTTKACLFQRKESKCVHVGLCKENEYIYTWSPMDYVEKLPVYKQSVVWIYHRAVDVFVLKKWRCTHKCELYVGYLGTAVEHEMLIVCMCWLREQGTHLRKGVAGKWCT